MSVSKVAKEEVIGLDETKSHRDARIKSLWDRLCTTGVCQLDVKGLQKGFRKIDHPLKNADNLLQEIVREVDTNDDGKIEFEEFRDFVEKAEKQLFILFRAIDKDGNGKLDATELQAAFKNSGLTVSTKKLDDFFQDMDKNNDGYISFEEWRNFLLFMPAHEHDSRLHAVLSYYNSVVNVSPEGDSTVSGDSLEGLGTESSSKSLFQSLFGSLFRVASPMPSSGWLPSSDQSVDGKAEPTVVVSPKRASGVCIEDVDASSAVSEPAATRRQGSQDVHKTIAGNGAQDQDQEESPKGREAVKKKYRLTDFAPDPGYFLAGAIAGGVSRTATAPIDRLKVYLLVNTTNVGETAATALRQGKPVVALRNALRPFGDAIKHLYKSGGIRGLFAGNGLNVVKIMPETAIKFGSYEAAKRALANLEGHGDAKQINSYSKFTAGGLAGMVAQFCVYPLDTLKFRLQCETVEGGLQGGALVRQTAVKMYADGGLRACYRGVTMGLIGMFPYSAIDMGMFELLKKSYKTYYAKQLGCHEDDVDVGNIATGIIGASSGAFGASVVYPLNVVRTRLQTQGTVMHPPTYTGIWDVTQKTIQKEGYRGLYKGLTPNLLKVAPALSITWVVYENSKRLLGLH